MGIVVAKSTIGIETPPIYTEAQAPQLRALFSCLPVRRNRVMGSLAGEPSGSPFLCSGSLNPVRRPTLLKIETFPWVVGTKYTGLAI